MLLKTGETGDEGVGEDVILPSNRDLGGREALCFLSGGWGSNKGSVSIEGNSKGSSVSGDEARRR